MVLHLVFLLQLQCGGKPVPTSATMSAAKALVLDLRPASGRVLPELRLSLFGRMRAETRGGCILPRSRKARALLAILALSPNRPVLRSHVTALLWSLRDKRQAQASLRQAVHELQHALPGTISSDRNHLVLLGRRLAVDALAFQTATPTRPEPLGLYAPPLLADLRGLDPAFDGWLTEQERQLARIACTIGEAVLAVQHDPAGTLRAAEHLLGIDPAHEAAWRAAIGVHLERN